MTTTSLLLSKKYSVFEPILFYLSLYLTQYVSLTPRTGITDEVKTDKFYEQNDLFSLLSHPFNYR